MSLLRGYEGTVGSLYDEKLLRDVILCPQSHHRCYERENALNPHTTGPPIPTLEYDRAPPDLQSYHSSHPKPLNSTSSSSCNLTTYPRQWVSFQLWGGTDQVDWTTPGTIHMSKLSDQCSSIVNQYMKPAVISRCIYLPQMHPKDSLFSAPLSVPCTVPEPENINTWLQLWLGAQQWQRQCRAWRKVEHNKYVDDSNLECCPAPARFCWDPKGDLVWRVWYFSRFFATTIITSTS